MLEDKDLVSIQQARILAENAAHAQAKLALFEQKKLNQIITAITSALLPHLDYLAKLSHEETDFGAIEDKKIKNKFATKNVLDAILPIHCVGVIDEDEKNKIAKIGVPIGVIAAFCPVTSPVSTTIYKTLIAIKAGNAIVFSLHPRAKKSMQAVLDIIIKAAVDAGLPEGAISYLTVIDKKGAFELMNCPAVKLIMITGIPNLREAAKQSGKLLIYGGAANSLVFIERSANIKKAVQDIIQSKNFDFGIATSAEQSVVVDTQIASEVEAEFKRNGAYFLSQEECDVLEKIFFHVDGRPKKDAIGKSPQYLAKRGGFTIPENTKLLIAKLAHVSRTSMFSKELLAPVIAYYLEDDWQHACEKCLELLIVERNAHALVIHSNDVNIIKEFALKKPVGRLLVNTSSTFGCIGMTTNLFPALTLGSMTIGAGIANDNISPMNLVYTRMVGYETIAMPQTAQTQNVSAESNAQQIQHIVHDILEQFFR